MAITFSWTALLFALSLILFQVTAHGDHEEEEEDHEHHDTDMDDPELQYVTCGSIISLVHVPTNSRLHSHDVKYGGGSGQQSVTGFADQGDTNNYWLVREAHGSPPCAVGDLIPKNTLIRLFHENTNQWLHSHLHTAPLSHEQEVSCYGSEDGGDTGDNWELITANDYWQRDAKIRLKHVDTGKFLNANGNIKYGNPIPGQLEISAVSRRSPDNVWTVMEGIYWEAKLPTGSNDNKDEL